MNLTAMMCPELCNGNGFFLTSLSFHSQIDGLHFDFGQRPTSITQRSSQVISGHSNLRAIASNLRAKASKLIALGSSRFGLTQ